jgi:hypothetical protein
MATSQNRFAQAMQVTSVRPLAHDFPIVHHGSVSACALGRRGVRAMQTSLGAVPVGLGMSRLTLPFWSRRAGAPRPRRGGSTTAVIDLSVDMTLNCNVGLTGAARARGSSGSG